MELLATTFDTAFTRRFSAAHRIADDAGACQRIHGHNYTAVIEVHSTRLGPLGFVLPADTVKDLVDRRFDHRLILDADDPVTIAGVADNGWVVRVPFPPSTENLAGLISRDVLAAVLAQHECYAEVTVHLHETGTIVATAITSGTR